MEKKNVIDNFETIVVETPVDKIIKQLKQLIVSGQLKPGDRLPPERLLAERFGVGRSYVRLAILKLEFYGLLKTSPQSGTYVSGYSIKMLDSIFTDIINFNKDDFSALIEARYYMEVQAVRLAAERRSKTDIKEMKEALNEYDSKIKSNLSAVNEDMLFHIKIASAAKNSIIESMLFIIIPDLIKYIVDNNICKEKRSIQAVAEHHKILEAIIAGNADAAETAMAEHLDDILQISKKKHKSR